MKQDVFYMLWNQEKSSIHGEAFFLRLEDAKQALFACPETEHLVLFKCRIEERQALDFVEVT